MGPDSGELESISENGSTTLASFAYDELGRRSSLTRGNGVETRYGFDNRSMLEEFTVDRTGTAYDESWTFARNQAGQVISRTALTDSAPYDEPAPTTGSLLFEANGLNQLTDVGTLDLTYDDRGNMTSDGVNTFGFDVQNRLTTYNSTTDLTYDPVGRLSGVDDGSTETYFLYDGADLIAEYDSSGNVIHRYVHGPGSDEPLVWYVGSGTGTRRYYVADQLGSIIAITDASGDPVELGGSTGDYARQYNEYGETDEAPAFGRFGYTGQVWIDAVGAWYYKARFYSPQHGRFLSPDPIGYGDGANMYAYVGNDPINMIDPSGMTGQSYDAPLPEYPVPDLRGILWCGANEGRCFNWGQHDFFANASLCQLVPEHKDCGPNYIYGAEMDGVEVDCWSVQQCIGALSAPGMPLAQRDGRPGGVASCPQEPCPATMQHPTMSNVRRVGNALVGEFPVNCHGTSCRQIIRDLQRLVNQSVGGYSINFTFYATERGNGPLTWLGLRPRVYDVWRINETRWGSDGAVTLGRGLPYEMELYNGASYGWMIGHEFFHSLGLGHSNLPNSIMNYTGSTSLPLIEMEALINGY